MSENTVSIRIAEADLTQVADAVKVITEVMAPHLIALTPGTRQKLAKMGDATLAFVRKALDYATTNPGVTPSFIDVAEFKQEVDAVNSLLQIMRPVEQVFQNLGDSVLLCGSKAYLTSLAFYNNVKRASKMSVPGAKAIEENLRARFAKTILKKEEPLPAAPAS